MTKLSPEEIKRIEAEAEAARPGDINFRPECGDFTCGASKSWVEGYVAHAEKAQPLVEALKLIRDIPGLAGLDFTSQKKYREHCMKMIDEAAREALNAYLAGGRK